MADYAGIDLLLDTTEGMECLVNNVGYDDTTLSVQGVDWFVFNGVAATTLYVSGNCWLGFGSNAEQLKVSRRDGKLWYLYRQEGTLLGRHRFLKLRWQGYTYYSQTSAVYALVFELFLLSDGRMLLNVVQSPTDGNYLGTSALVCGSSTYPLRIGTNANCPVRYTFTPRGEGGTAWEIAAGKIEVVAPFYLVRSGGTLYTEAAGTLQPVQPVEGVHTLTHYRVGNAWVDTGQGLLRRTDDKATMYSYAIRPGATYTITVTEPPDRWRVATCATDPALLPPEGSAPAVRVLEVHSAVPQAGYTYSFTAQQGEGFLCLHISANNALYEMQVQYTGASLAAAFAQYGSETAPDGALLLTLSDPEVLCWQENTEVVPRVTAVVAGTPPPQTLAAEIDLGHESIRGLVGMTANYQGDVTACCSVDDGASWSEAQPLSDFLNTDCAALWAAVQQTKKLLLRFVLTGSEAALTAFQMSYKN